MAKSSKKSKSKSSSSHRSTSHSDHALTKSALRLIDEAAGLLKKGIVLGAKESSKGREALKKKAFTLVNSASRHLNDAIESGTDTVRRGIRKL